MSKPKHPSRIDFLDYKGRHAVRIGHGANCLFIKVEDGAAVLAADEAENLGWNLIRQARYSREAAAA